MTAIALFKWESNEANAVLASAIESMVSGKVDPDIKIVFQESTLIPDLSREYEILNDGMDSADKKDFDKQLIVLLKDFKISYFTKLIQTEINKNESKAQEISSQMNKYYLSNSKLKASGEKNPHKKSSYLTTINDNNKEIETLNAALRKTEIALTDLKKELNRIK